MLLFVVLLFWESAIVPLWEGFLPCFMFYPGIPSLLQCQCTCPLTLSQRFMDVGIYTDPFL